MAKVCPQCGTRYEEDQRFCSKDGATLVAEQQGDTLTGIVLADRYLVKDKLGEGGMGEVYLAEHVRIKRKVAVKVMRNWMTNDPGAILRFHREAENASQITHPNVAAVYDFGETELGGGKKLVYLAMEFVPGKPLTTILEQDRVLNHIRTSDIVSQVADALSAAHSLGILHRDLKPDNVMVAETRVKTDLVKLLDFGIARVMDKKTQHFTSTGMIVGTPEWMSPEQISGDTLKTGTDIYALGLMAFRMLTGEGAFGGGSPQDILLAKMTKPPLRLIEAAPDIAWPAALQSVFDRVLSADAGSRYDDALAFASDFYYAVTQLPMTPDAEAYLALLSQRAVTPTRGMGTVESTTPVVGVQGLTESGPRPTFVARSSTPAVGTPTISTTDLPAGVRSAPVSTNRGSEEITAPIAVDALIAASNAETAEVEPLSTPAGPSAVTSGAGSGRGKALFYTGAAASVVLVAAIAMWAASATGSADGDTAAAPNAAAADSAARARSDSGGLDSATLAAMGPIISATSVRMPLDTVRARSENSVFRIVGSKGQGAGFLADSQGVVLTSSTFVGANDTVSVFLDGYTRLLGRVLAVDSARGLAAVRIPMRRCRRCSALALATDSMEAQTGDSILVVGAPSLVARRSSARGNIAERDDARGRLTTSARVNASAVGGPVLAEKQLVLGVVRPGAANAATSVTTLASAKQFMDETMSALARTPAIDSLPPTWPRRAVRAEALTEAQSRTRDEIIRRYGMSSGDFDILVMTPQVVGWRQRKVREARQASPFGAADFCTQGELCDVLEEWRSGRDYVTERRAVVIVQVSPRAALQPKFGAFATRKPEFRRGNVGAMSLTRDGVVTQPIEATRVHAVVNPEAYPENQRYYSAIYVYSADVFAGAQRIFLTVVPEGGGGPANFQLKNEIVQAVAADVGPYVTAR
jgi:serine/threonine protein kinase